MIFKFLPFITTTLIIRSESFQTRLTSKPSLPSDLQELLDSLYMTGYIPEYILPEDELTETEKTEGEYLDFPDLKNAQDDVFVPPESEYSKNNLHYKNIKAHKRLIPKRSWNLKNQGVWEQLWDPRLFSGELRSDLNSQLENATGNDPGQNIAKLDFLIPIPERGTYAMENISLIHDTPPTLYDFSNTETTSNTSFMKTTQGIFNKEFVTTQKPIIIIPYTYPSYSKHQFIHTSKNTIFETNQTPYSPQMLTTRHFQPPLTDLNPTPIMLPPALTVKQNHYVLPIQQSQNVINPKQARPVLTVQQLQSILTGPQPQVQKTNRTLHGSVKISGKEQLHTSSRKPISKTRGNKIEAKVVSQAVNKPNPVKIETVEIKEAIQKNIPLTDGIIHNLENKVISQTNSSSIIKETVQKINPPNSGTIQNLETNVISPTNNSYGSKPAYHQVNIPINNGTIQIPDTKIVNQPSSLSNTDKHEVQVVENTSHVNGDQPTQKKKMFTFLNIFKKNKKQPHQVEQNQNTSLESKTESRASSLTELYNQLISTNVLDEDNRIEIGGLVNQEIHNEEIPNHKRKKK